MSGRLTLILGDIITLAIVTIMGFASHGTAGSAGAYLLMAFTSLVVSWLFTGNINLWMKQP